MAGAIEKIVNYRFQMHGARQMGVSLRGLATAGAAVGAALVAAGAAFYTLVNRVTSAAAEIEDMSRATGVAASELAALGYVLEQDGADIGALETGIRKMTRTINDANTGMKEYQDTFTQIGVDYASLQGLLPEEQFYVLAQAISEVEDQSVKMALAQEIFGRGAMELLPTLDRGEDGIREFTDEARELGIVLGDEVYEASKKFQDKMLEIKSQISGELLAAITDPSNGIIPAFEEFGETLVELADEDLGNAIAALSEALPALLQIATNILNLLANIEAARSHIMDRDEAHVIAASAHATILQGALSQAAASGQDSATGWHNYLEVAREIDFLNQDLILTQLEFNMQLDSFNRTLNATSNLMRDGNAEWAQWVVAADTLTETGIIDEMDRLNTEYERGNLSLYYLNSAMDYLVEVAGRIPNVIESVSFDDGGGGTSGVLGYIPPPDEIEKIAITSKDLLDNLKERYEITQSMREIETGKGSAYDIKRQALQEEISMQQQVNDLMMRGAQDFGQILMKGGDDWAEQMFAHLAKMALQHAAMQAGPIGFIGGFLGGFL